MAEIFHDLPANWQVTKKLLDGAWTQLAGSFESRARHDAFFAYLLTPRSNRWAFASSGRTGTSSALMLLFRLEFGCTNSAGVDDPGDLNRHAEAHRTVQAGVFRSLHQRDDIPSLTDYLDRTLRIATVRHPTTRAWSSFRYLCRSHAERHAQFSRDRIRLCATTGFDWARDPLTRGGFERFMDYIALEVAANGTLQPDNHWRPQWQDIRPAVFRPQILGRVEAPADFVLALVDHLGLAPGDPGPIDELRLNAADQKLADLPDWMSAPSVRDRLRTVYGGDYEAFGYDP
ncbi:MAG: sulfotransferase family 2 domain-containing protein [Rhodobacterales bacterium]|nr:sulfotransferase family 2 domain-containing protein [Rhodobacterales bacterium]